MNASTPPPHMDQEGSDEFVLLRMPAGLDGSGGVRSLPVASAVAMQIVHTPRADHPKSRIPPPGLAQCLFCGELEVLMTEPKLTKTESVYTKLGPVTLARMMNKSASENRHLRERLKALSDEQNEARYQKNRSMPDAVYEVVCDLCHVSTAGENESHDPIEIDFLGYLFDDYGPKENDQDADSPEMRTVRMSASQALHLGISLLQAARVHGYDLSDFDVSQLNAPKTGDAV